jgi:hypothetical protein
MELRMPDRRKQPYTVFVSHSSLDTWVAKKIAEEIGQRGADTSLDEAQIQIGENVDDRIFSALESASELLVLLTPWAIERPYVWAELGAARVRRILIIGVVHGQSFEDVLQHPKALSILKERNLVQLNNVDRYFEQLGYRVIKARTRVAGGRT